MRILIISSCTGEKSVTAANQLTLADFRQGHDHVASREQELAARVMPAEELYSGLQHQRLMRGVRAVRDCATCYIDLWILSAGYGLVAADCKLAPYEATFIGMKRSEARAWADQLGVARDVRKVLAKSYDLGLVLLGDDYLDACALDASVKLGGPTVLFCGKNTAKKLPQVPGLIPVILANTDAKRFSCGLIGLKGEVAARLLERTAAEPSQLADLIRGHGELLDRLASNHVVRASSHSTARANPTVDRVIELPDSWRNKPHRNKLAYFIPEWDDLVDPDFNFETDTHAGGSGDWSNEVYAHQIYPEPNYDGILISKVVAEKTKKKAERINQLGVHRYLRVPREFPIMGDCGAFGYINQEIPPYNTDEILDYYTRLDFDLGVSIDHLIVKATDSQRQERYELTIHNAEKFIREHGKRGLAWTPVGAVQGWDSKSYADAARSYVAMGYRYIGLGGLVRTPTVEVLRILETVKPHVPDSVSIHLFGLARLAGLQEFARLGVRSVDSASFLRRAWMGTGQNYLTLDGLQFAAIRIPEAEKSFRAKRMVSEGRAHLDEVKRLERACLDAMHALDHDKATADQALDVLAEYDQLITPDRPDNRALLKKVLEARPWKSCPCTICQRDGIDVIIFRGNNRNRRRGFHNTYAFYRLLQRALAGERIVLGGPSEDADESQMALFEDAEATT